MLSRQSKAPAFVMSEAIIGTCLFCLGLVFFLEQNRFLDNQTRQTTLKIEESQELVNLSYQLIVEDNHQLSAKEQKLLNKMVK